MENRDVKKFGGISSEQIIKRKFTPFALRYALSDLWSKGDNIKPHGFGITQHNIHVLNSFS